MEAAPRLPMISFDLKVCTENTQFGPQLKQYIAAFYNEDPESYATEIHNLESLRATAVRPSMDINGVQLLKKYYCQLHFLKSRFPMEENQDAAVQFLWKDNQAGMNCGGSDIRFELMVIMYNIGALHSYLGSTDSRSSPEGMKMACTHFQCAAWAFQTVKEKYHQFVIYISSVELIHFFQQVSLAQAQECILEKSMLDNRKATIIAKVAVQVHSYYRQSLSILQSTNDELVGSKTYKEWTKYLQFKVAYHKCVALLFQGQQAEEQQKMGERVAFYQAACEQLEEARKISSGLKSWQQEINESLAFTSDVVEGKRKAAKNENEFIYHEEVPDKDHLQEVKGASLVKGIPFSVNDVEVSGPDIFTRLVPMEAHEAASLYSESKAQMLRQIGELVENKDQSLAELMSSMHLDLLPKMNQATGIPQELIDRAAALSARPTATQDLMEVMRKLSNIYQDVESNLNEIDSLLKEEEESEKRYQELMGKRPPSIIATDLAREAAKYREAHTKANDSNQTLHRAMTAHVANLKILQQPLRQLQHQLPSIELPNPNIDERTLKDLDALVSKVEEMRNQRAMLWAQFRDAVHKDDITNSLVTKQPNQSLEQLFQQELQKHQQLAGLIEQNCSAQENIRKALVDSYAKAVNTRRYVQDIIQKRNSTITALIASHDTYDDLLAKANKGIEFYTKLETNVSKLLQRIKSACKVQQEEREQILEKNDVVPKQDNAPPSPAAAPPAPKLKDYLESRKVYPDPNLQYHQQQVNYNTNLPQQPQNMVDTQTWPPAVRPAPLGSEGFDLPKGGQQQQEAAGYPAPNAQVAYPYQMHDYATRQGAPVDQDIINRMNNLLASIKGENTQHKSYSEYIPQNYATSITQAHPTRLQSDSFANVYDPTKAYTTTTDSYRPLSSCAVPNDSNTHMQYDNSSLAMANQGQQGYQYPSYPQQTREEAAAPTSAHASNVNAYYPSGYDPNVSARGQYHSEYATTTFPDYNSTYSSPTSGTNVAQSSFSTYPYTGALHAGSTGQNEQCYAGAGATSSYPTDGTTATTSNAQNFGYPTGGTATFQPMSSYPTDGTTATPNVQNYGYPTGGAQQGGTATYQLYSSATTSLDSQNYPGSTPYSSGTTPNYQTGTNVVVPEAGGSFPTPYSTGTTQSYQAGTTAVSHPGQIPEQSYSATFPCSSGTYQTYQNVQGGTNAVYSSGTATAQYYQTDGGNTFGSQQAYSGTAYPNYNTQNYPAVPVPAKESNVDLLSGLDFTISQAPLIPQRQAMPESEGGAKAVSESEVILPKKIVEEEKKPAPVEVKRPEVKVLPSKQLNNDDVKRLFGVEVERYEKYVETLSDRTLSGPTNLDVKWKEIGDRQEREGRKKIVSVARCYPMKNRFPDILPYDYSRVELCDAKDDYINASYVMDISPYAPPFIVTQAPIPSTYGDFWTMIREQQVELIFCILNDNEIGDDIYWPKEKGRPLSILNMIISLQSVIIKSHWVERLISVNLPEKRDSWVVMHLQFTSWPGSLFPTSPDPFVSYVLELITLYQQQRCATHPVVVHCSSGIGKSGLACLLTAAIFDVTNNANSIPDLASLTSKLTNCRKNILRDREHLKFAYEAFLAYMKQVIAQDKLKKRLNEVVPKLQEEIKQSVEVVEKNDDPLNSLDPFWANKK